MAAIWAEIITIGDEILYGQITNTNTQWISARLDELGMKTVRHTSIGDGKQEILTALAEAGERAHIIILTGGLGPTKDDITKHTLAEFFDSALEMHPEALADLTELLNRRNRPMNELNRLQALQPVKSTYLKNRVGTAPGMWFDRTWSGGKQVYVSLPGVPQEMYILMEEQVIPRIKQQFQTPVIYHQVARTIAIPESNLAQIIEDWEDALPPHIRLAYLPSFGQVKLRLTATGEREEDLKAEVASQFAQLEPLINKNLYSLDNEEFEQVVVKILLQNNLTLSVAESFTGGELSRLLTSVPGVSAALKGSVVAYSPEAKVQVLGIPQAVIDQHGVYSSACAEAMAQAAQKRFGTDYALATTGVAGPEDDGDTPAGHVWLALAGPQGVVSVHRILLRQRDLNIKIGASFCLLLLWQQLKGLPVG